LLNKYATSDEMGLIFCIHGFYFIFDRTFSPFIRSLNLRWWNWSCWYCTPNIRMCVPTVCTLQME